MKTIRSFIVILFCCLLFDLSSQTYPQNAEKYKITCVGLGINQHPQIRNLLKYKNSEHSFVLPTDEQNLDEPWLEDNLESDGFKKILSAKPIIIVSPYKSSDSREMEDLDINDWRRKPLEDYKEEDWEKLKNHYYTQLKKAIINKITSGETDIEIRTVSHISLAGYKQSETRELAERFTETALEALYDALKDLNLLDKSDIDALTASNDTGTYSKAMINLIKKGKKLIKKILYVNGRGSIEDAEEIIDELGQENVSIIATKGDFWASFKQLGNRYALEKLKLKYKNVKIYLMNPKGLIDWWGEPHELPIVEPDKIEVCEELTFTSEEKTKLKWVKCELPIQIEKIIQNKNKREIAEGEKKKKEKEKEKRKKKSDDKFIKPPDWPPPPPPPLPVYRFNNQGNIGGVLLQGSASIDIDENSNKEQIFDSFSLCINGEDENINTESFRKFITALWAVYYSDEPPGISIDPIDPSLDKHLVRYIGNVINSDLGRVMREADYTMKKWAIGTEKPDIHGFKDVDELMSTTGVNYFGTSRRFWFIPENMKFKKSNNMLIFDSGRMTLKAEYYFQNKQTKSEPADEEFAKFFTDHYDEIAQKYPVYYELLEYAKLVSLAQFIKESGAPVQWFLIANKDLLLSEDSPGVVNELIKGSKYFEGVEIRGGVDLDYHKGKYVYDAATVKAIQEAYLKFNSDNKITSLYIDPKVEQIVKENITFYDNDQPYTIIPQNSLTSGKDFRGIRYQTDVALKQKNKPGLEVIRYFNPEDSSEGVFGYGWHLLIPYQIEPLDSNKIQFKNVLLPAKMVLVNKLTNGKEILKFDTTTYSLVGYTPDNIEQSKLLGIFLMTDLSYRMADKIGNEFHFDQAGDLTDMILGDDFVTHYEYYNSFITNFENKPFALKKANNETVEFAGVILPKVLTLSSANTNEDEEYIFEPQESICSYTPKNKVDSKYDQLIVMTDGSFRLIDKTKNEIAFNSAGEFEGIALNPLQEKVISSISQGENIVKFVYGMRKEDNVRISKCNLFNKEDMDKNLCSIIYNYDKSGRLIKTERR